MVLSHCFPVHLIDEDIVDGVGCLAEFFEVCLVVVNWYTEFRTEIRVLGFLRVRVC